ncbi:MAG: hypothetical protein HZA79_05070 [Sphingobacteriales bacterium]|nr:hypothetical protein [Sphingobacteriales bacterium]
MQILEKVFIAYWSQILLIASGVWHVVSWYQNHNKKKIEARHLIFHEKKIEAISGFYKEIGATESMWYSFSIHKVIARELNDVYLDTVVTKQMQSLNRSLIELKLYLPNNQMTQFEECYELMQSLNYNLVNAYMSFSPNEKRTAEANEFMGKRKKVLLEVNKRLEKASEMIRLNFDSN